MKHYNLRLVLQRRKKLAEDQDVLACECQLTKKDFREYVSVLQRLLLPTRVSFRVLSQSLSHLAGAQLTKPLMRETAWFVSGNLPRLRKGEIVQPWTRQRRPEWVPLQILRVEPCHTRHGKAAARFEFQVLAGSPCPLRLSKTWTARYAAFLAESFGFSKSWGTRPYQDILELTNFRLLGLFTSQTCVKGLSFEQLEIPASLQKFNRALMKLRARTGTFQCPREYPNSFPCYLCPAGQTGPASCRAAVHEHSYVERLCAGCHKLAWFDPGRPNIQVCVNCAIRKERKHAKSIRHG